jgi:hypothetical protein
LRFREKKILAIFNAQTVQKIFPSKNEFCVVWRKKVAVSNILIMGLDHGRLKVKERKKEKKNVRDVEEKEVLGISYPLI